MICFQLSLICRGVDRSLYILSGLNICLPYGPKAICRSVIKALRKWGDVEIAGGPTLGPLTSRVRGEDRHAKALGVLGPGSFQRGPCAAASALCRERAKARVSHERIIISLKWQGHKAHPNPPPFFFFLYSRT